MKLMLTQLDSQSLIVAAIVACAMGYLLYKVVRKLRGDTRSSCASGCGKCASSGAPASTLLQIGSLPKDTK
jgi:hypothetical protein